MCREGGAGRCTVHRYITCGEPSLTPAAPRVQRRPDPVIRHLPTSAPAPTPASRPGHHWRACRRAHYICIMSLQRGHYASPALHRLRVIAPAAGRRVIIIKAFNSGPAIGRIRPPSARHWVMMLTGRRRGRGWPPTRHDWFTLYSDQIGNGLSRHQLGNRPEMKR